MLYLILVVLAIPSPFIGIAEAIAIVIGLQGQHSWILTGWALALGQTIGFCLIYFFGDRVLGRIPKLKRQIDRIDRDKFQARAPYFLATGSVTGLPPHLAMAALCPLIGQRFLPFLGITFVGRCVRFMVFAGTPAFFAQYFGIDGLPDWVTSWLA